MAIGNIGGCVNSVDLERLKSGIILSDVVRPYISKGLKKTGSELNGLCPFHTESTPSFSVNDDKGLYHCFGCRAAGDVFKFLQDKLHIEFPAAVEIVKNMVGDYTHIQPREKPVEVPIIPVPTTDDSFQFKYGYSEVYYYRNKDGELLYKVARYEATDINPKKKFNPATHTKDGWKLNAPTEGRVPYNSESLINPGMGLILEGEKCVDKGKVMLRDRALITWMGGSGAIRLTDMTPLQDGRKWVLWMDNDQGGIDTAHYLGNIIENLYIIPIPADKPKGWDIADAIEEGWGIEEISAFINTKIPYSEWALTLKGGAEKAIEVDKTPQLPIEEPKPYFAPKMALELFSAPGLVGKIMKWMNETALFPLPELELAGAIALAGIILGHKVKTKTDLRSNMMVMGICTSGAGKDHVRKCIKSFLRCVDLSNLLGGKPKSGAAVITMAAKNYGRCLWIPDEMGRMLLSISGKYAAGHQLEIPTNIMELSTTANSVFHGDELANRDGKTPRVDIDQPCFCVYGVSTPDNLYAAMSSKQAIDGFLSRWTIFEVENPYEEEDEDVNIYEEEYNLYPPEELIAEVKEWESRPCYNKTTLSPEPVLVPYTKESVKIIGSFYRSVRKKIRTEARNAMCGEDAFSSIWSRAAEHANKLALCAHENGEISEEVMKWGIEVAKFCAEKMTREVAENISDNEHEANVKKVLAVIRRFPRGIVRGELSKKTPWLRDHRHRKDILDFLQESGQIEMIPYKAQNKNEKDVDKFFII